MRVLKRGSSGDNVLKLQKGLALLGYQPGNPDGVFGAKTLDALDDFQEDNDLLPDGVFGKGTAAVFNARVPAELQITLAPAVTPADVPKKNKWTEVPCHKAANGFDHTTLRDDAAISFSQMYTEVTRLGGKLTSAGGKRALSQGGGKAQSLTSMHYLGRAHDMALGAGMQNPKKDPVVVVREDPATRKWVVWMRTSNPDVPVVTLQGVQCSTVNDKTVLKTVEVTDRFFNFTALALKFGWKGISGRRKFFRGGGYTSAEWWHFQWEQGLVPGQTTFGSELLRLYTPEQCTALRWWDDVKGAEFGEDFN